jgi:Putative peptidoglycan binding domain
MSANETEHSDTEADEVIVCTAPDDGPAAAAGLAADANLPINTKLTLPLSGLYSINSSTSGQFAIAQTIQAVQEVGQIWAGRHPDDPIGIGDISKSGGGDFPPHMAHKRGIEVDIRPLRNDGKEQPTTFDSAKFSRELTQELVDLFNANSVLAVNKIFFNDPGMEGVAPLGGHHNHLHVRFELPGASAPPLLVLNNRKPAVRELQRRLNAWIKTSGPPGLEPVEVTGLFDSETEQAVKAFQTANGLGVDGKVGKNTWGKLPKV